jgi:anthranilate phosphoribosyltransferase
VRPVKILAFALGNAIRADDGVGVAVARGLDELVPGVPASGVEVENGWTRPWSYDPVTLSQRAVEIPELAGGDAQGNAGMLERLLEGEDGPRREAVLLYVAVALTVEGKASDVADGYERGRAAIDSGAARAAFDRMREKSRPRTP